MPIPHSGVLYEWVTSMRRRSSPPMTAATSARMAVPRSPRTTGYGPRGNAFNGQVKGVQLADAAENLDHPVSPEEAVRIAMTRQ
jgi:hypothetical protein